MKAVYASDGNGDGDGDGYGDLVALPGVDPTPEMAVPVASVELDVDGEQFEIRPDQRGGTHYTWLTGPNSGYGFGGSPTHDASLDDHRENIRGFLAMIDPATGYIAED